ncbi:MAG: M28 family peptidase [Caldilineaceae bacterium]|nr:M28 family peptidase [Caldilineaceae bacterium]
MRFDFRKHQRRLWHLLLVLLFSGSLLFHQPPPTIANPATGFDGTEALANATHLATTIGERAAGSEGERVAAAWLATQFTNLGYSVTVEPFAFTRLGKATLGMNIVAVKAGQPDSGTIYIGAHYDTAPYPFAGPGANDNASGVGVLLETARILTTQPLTPTLTLVAFGAEEDYLVGSSRYVAQLTPVERMQAVAMLNLDCVGIGTALYLNVIRKEHLAFAQKLGITVDEIRYDPRAQSDHASFAAIGMPALYFDMHNPGEHPCGRDYHTARECADKLDVAALQRTGDALLTALTTLSDQEARRPIWQHYLPLVHNASR